MLVLNHNLLINQRKLTSIQVTCLIPLVFVCLMVFNASFNKISAITWGLVLLVEETGGSGENHRLFASHWQTLSHNVVHLALRFELTTYVVIDNDCIGSCKFSYHTIKATTDRLLHYQFSEIQYFCTFALALCHWYKLIKTIVQLTYLYNKTFNRT